MAFSDWCTTISRFILLLASALIFWTATGCGSRSGDSTPPPQASVTISPRVATVPIGTFQPFTAFAIGTTSTAVTWSASAGNIDDTGNYTAPPAPPAGETATVTATSVSSPSASASATVTITTQPVTLSVSPASATVKAGFTQTYTAAVSGTTNQSVSWSANSLPGDASYPGSISGGLYIAPAPVLEADTYSIVAVSDADPTKTASASVTVTSLENQVEQQFPIELGTSGVNADTGDCCTGTLGSLLTDQNGKQYILSNNHVIGRVGHAVAGEAIVQPGYVDTQCNLSLPNEVAHFTVAPPIQGSNVDAAIAEVVAGAVDTQGGIIGLGGIASDGSYITAPPASTTVAPAVGMAIAKSGRTTGLSCGTILAVDGDILVDLPADCGNTVVVTIPFNGQVVMGDVAQHGDSGSLFVEAATSRPMALLAAGTSDGQYFTANPIGEVLAALDSSAGLTFSFVGAGQHAVSCSAEATMQVEISDELQAAQPDIVPSEEISLAVVVKNKYEPAVMGDAAVLGMAVGRSETRRGRAAIMIFVVREKARYLSLPANLDGFEVRVVPTGRFKASAAPKFARTQCPASTRHRLEPAH